MYHANVDVYLMEENAIQINGAIMRNVNVRVKNIMYVKKIMFGIAACNCENGKHLASIMDDSATTCDEILESYNEETNFNKKKAIGKTQVFYVFLAFLLTTIALLIARKIYCYFITHPAKQKHLLTLHFTNNKLKEIIY